MWQKIVEDALAPIGRRIGTALGSAALVYGATADVANAVELAAVWLVGLGVDLALSKAERGVRKGRK